jgi:protein O-GlcNAc transferase
MLARAVAAHQAGDLTQAEFLYKLVLQADRKQFDALHMLAVIEGQRGNYAAGLQRLNEALRIKPNSADALINLGRMQSELGDDAGAIASYGKALARNPRSALAHSNLSIALRRQGETEAALQHCDAALKLVPDFADAWTNRSNVLFDLDRYDEALAGYDKAIASAAEHAGAHLGRSIVLNKLKRHDEALDACDRALKSNPASFEAWLSRSESLLALGRFDDALYSIDRALQLKADEVRAWLCRGKVLAELKRYDEAVGAFDQALGVRPDLAEAWLGRGSVFLDCRRFDEAFAAYDRALLLDPQLVYAEGQRLHAKLQICDWTNLAGEIDHLLLGVRDGRRVCVPFLTLSTPASAADQLECAVTFMADQPRFPPIVRGRAHAHDRIRLAYVSSDFRDHAVAYLTAGLFEHHDKSRFQSTAISSAPIEDSNIRRRIASSFDRFIDVPTRTDQAVAELIKELEIDIAVDLNGLSRNGRRGAFARRAAPVQVNYLGYAGTMGADYYDYIIADATVIPPADFGFYSEKVVWLPDSFLVTDGARSVADGTPSRSELGLPETGFVFCAFNQSHKIDPTIFDVWMRLLQAAEGSVLWLKPDDATAERNLRLESQHRGVAAARLVFAQPVRHVEDHLARLRQADLFLDTLNYNAHTTASDALSLGVPVVTCLGSTFAGRVAASLLRATGLPELVTGSLAEYETLALMLARDSEKLAALKSRLAGNRGRWPLFDTARFTRDIEAAFTTMWRRSRDGQPPASFAVDRAAILS